MAGFSVTRRGVADTTSRLSGSVISVGAAAPASGSAGAHLIVRSDGTVGYANDTIDFDAWRPAGDAVTDDSAVLLAAINAAAGRPLWLSRSYNVSLNLTDQDVHLVGPGKLIHQQAKNLISVLRTLGPSITVSAQGTVQLGPNTPAAGLYTETNSKLSIGATTLVGITEGDLFLISSQDQYGWTTQLGTVVGTTTQVWQAAQVPVLGIGLTINLTGTINEGDTVTGATSGATGIVQSIAATASAAFNLLFHSVTGDFQNGENIQVSGVTQATAAAVGFIVMDGLLDDTYTTTPVIRKVPTTGKFVIDGPSIQASGDVDSIVGAANRLPAIVLQGVYKPEVKVRTISAWTRAIQVMSCYGGYFENRIDKLPNNANVSESAYGYGVEFGAATEKCTAVVRGGNCRHAFTTNVFWGTWAGFGSLQPAQQGVPKDNVVRDSYIYNAMTSFDTHWGAYRTKFLNCVSFAGRSGQRNISGSAGFQNRAFGTTYENCHDHGSVVGFLEGSVGLDAGFVNFVKWRNCTSTNYAEYGWAMTGNTVASTARYELDNVEVIGDGTAVNTPYLQAGFLINSGVVHLKGCTSRRFNGYPFRFVGSAGNGRLTIEDFTADYYDAVSGVGAARLDTNPGELNFLGIYKVRASPLTVNLPPSAFRIAGGAVTMNFAADLEIVGAKTGSAIPFAAVTAGTLTGVNYLKRRSPEPIAYIGDAGATLVAGESSPVQVWNTALTANRTATLDTTAGSEINGDTFRIVRTAASTGAFTLTVGSKTLAAGQFVDVHFDGTAWVETAFGSL